MEHYAGLDVSLELTSVCIVDERGRIICETKVPSDPEALVRYFETLKLAIERVGLEAGPLSQWIHAALVDAGFETVLLTSREGGAVGDECEDRPARRSRHCPAASAWLVPTGAREVRERAGGASAADIAQADAR